MKYLVSCDLDETLLTTDKKIKRKSIKYIKKFINDGNYFILSSGRPFLGVIDFYELLKIKMPFVTDNGASIYFPVDGGYKQISFGIDVNVFKEFLNQIAKYIEYGISSNTFTINFENRASVPNWIIHTEGSRTIINEGKLKDIINTDPLLPNIWIKNENIDKVLEIYKNDYKNDYNNDYSKYFNIRIWHHDEGIASVEMFSVNASKGNALNYLKNLYQVDKTIAFGDQLNDESMLDMADIGVCMINGIEKLKIKYTHITDYDNNHNGVVRYLKKLIK